MDIVDISQVSVALDDEAVGNQEVSFCNASWELMDDTHRFWLLHSSGEMTLREMSMAGSAAGAHACCPKC